MQTTKNLGLNLPEAGDFADIEKINENFEKLDSEVSEIGNKMDKNNPTGTGSFSMNRKDGTDVGEYSHAEGYRATASGENSHAEGYYAEAIGAESHAEGFSTQASGEASHAEGFSTKATGIKSHAEGISTKAVGEASHAEGGYTESSGNRAHAEGSYATASNDSSHAEGSSTTASGVCSHAEGANTTADGDFSHVEGYYSTASEMYSHAGGIGSVASASYSFAHGSNAKADVAGSVAFGTANKMQANTLFALGNGSDNSTRSNAMSVTLGGSVKSASTITASTTADYAEFFEWLDGNVDIEDRVGHFVTLDGNKIRIATDKDDYILGVISGEPFVLGNGDCDVWNGMYLRDKFRRRLLEPAPKTEFVLDEDGKPTGEMKEVLDENGNVVYEGERLVLNPEYDNTKQYINRADRPEWDAVGMLGVLPVIHDGTAKVNGYVTVNKDGIATACDKTHENAYRVIHVNADDVVEIIFR